LPLNIKWQLFDNKLLRERNFGDYQGKRNSVYQKQLKDLLEKRNSLPKEERFKFKLQNNIESDEEIVDEEGEEESEEGKMKNLNSIKII